MRGRILYFAYQTPPLGGARGLRILNIIKELKRLGWEIDVVTVNANPSFPFYDEELLKALPCGIKVHRTCPGLFRYIFTKYVKEKGSNSARMQRFSPLRFIRKAAKSASQMLPDIIFEWLPFALLKANSLRKNNHYDLVLSSAWPFTSHIAAYLFSKGSNTPLALEYGDPWAFNPLEKKSKAAQKVSGLTESRVLKKASLIITTTDETKKAYLNNYPFLKESDVLSMPSGVDMSAFAGCGVLPSKKFRIVLTGRLYSTSGIKVFLSALKLFVEEDDKRKEQLEVIFIGEIESVYHELIRDFGLSEVITRTGFMPYKEAVLESIEASALLFISNENSLQVPSRLFHYLAARRPILFVKSAGFDPTLNYLNGKKCAEITENETQSILSALNKLFLLHQKGELDESFDLSLPEGISWESRIKALDKALSEITEARRNG